MLPAADAPRSSHQDVLLLGDRSPTLLRLHVHIDGQLLPAAWERHLDKLFADLDRDNDGVLTKAEAARAPSAAFLQSYLQASLNLEAADDVVPFQVLDADGDGRVSRRELAAYYDACGLQRLRIVLLPEQGHAAALTDTLFRLLDSDSDGKLSKAELQAAAATLRRIDLNEDEWLTADELLLHRSATTTKAKPVTLVSIGFVPLPLTGDQTRAVLARYAPRKLDLDAAQTQELTVRLGKLDKDAVRLESKAAKPTDDGLLLDAGGLALEVHTGPADGSVRGLHAFYRQQFDAADADKRGFLERKQVADVPTLAALFVLADRNADGKLTDKEFDAFLELHALGAASFASLTVADQSLGLFDLLDADRDGRLSQRELHGAWERLRGLDRDNDGALTRAEFPRQLRARVALGKASLRAAARKGPERDPVPSRGPTWFRKMDRNADGHVSRREFVGPEELFDKLDTDRDGLLSPEEAGRLPE